MSDSNSPNPTPPDQTKPAGQPVPLSGINTILTAVAAIVGTIGTIVATLAAHLASGAKDEAISARGKTSELKQTVEDLSARRDLIDDNYKYVDYILKYQGRVPDPANVSQPKDVSPPPAETSKDPDHRLATLTALSLVAHANTSEAGNSTPEDRACLPIFMALIEHEAGLAAYMDRDLAYVENWMAYAETAEDAKIRATAVKAICINCRLALRDRDFPRLLRGIKAIDHLLKLLPIDYLTDPTIPKPLGLDVLTVTEAGELRLQLLSIDRDLLSPNTSPQATNTLRASDIRDIEEISKIFDVYRLETWKLKDGLKLAESQAKSDAAGAIKNPTPLNDAVRTESSSALKVIADTPTIPPSSLATFAPPQNGQVTASVQPVSVPPLNIDNAIKSLSDPEDTVRYAARENLAAAGQDAVKPMLDSLNASKSDPRFDKTQLGIALALQRMKQPVYLDPDQAGKVVDLLKSENSDTRAATVNFLINLENTEAIHNCYQKLKELVDGAIKDNANPGILDKKAKRRAALNAVTAIAGWMTALNDIVPGPAGTEHKSMSEEAEACITAWKPLMIKPAGDWQNTIKTIDEMLLKARAYKERMEAAKKAAAERAAQKVASEKAADGQ